LDIGTSGQLLEPPGSLSCDEAIDIFKEEITAGVSAGADIIVIETMTDLGEARAAVLAAKENSSLPVMCTMTFEKNQRTFTGCGVPSMTLTLEGLGIDAIGINCSLGPDDFAPLVEELAQWTTLPIVVKPNAGLPDPNTGKFNFPPDKFADYIAKLVPLGIKIVGGCCGTNPETIKAIGLRLKGTKPVLVDVSIPVAVCSATKAVIIDRVRIIGERINPTGKKLFKQALLNQDVDYIISQALQQIDAGADILDVNVGMPGVDEKDMMLKSIKALQGVLDVPLQLDSSDIEVLETGLRHYNGKAIVNSVNGDEESLSSLLPIVKKYGAAVVGLTLDKDGIPKTAQQRYDIARRILMKALELGIQRENVFIDCLTLTASAEQEAVTQTLNALKMVKDSLGLKTVLGVSNISFGLPERETVNQTFLTLALAHGLDLPILNPNIDAMMGAVRAFHVLYNYDKGASEYIAQYANSPTVGNPSGEKKESTDDLGYAVESGLKQDAARITEELLKTTQPMDIVNNKLIPALDKTGSAFEKGILFLPQLIQAAGAAQAAFEVIRSKLAKVSGQPLSKGIIVLATVKGDIHDIGKNIVKVLLQNYGYTVIDLGRDVNPQAVVDTAIKYKADMIGLSALMTTTLKSMEQTISLIKQNNLPVKTMVGGAVLTAEYAVKIGADYYAKDAKESVDIAKKVIG
ncbi:MAG: dihydropteroate synthase, partial [Oscillospiraceae bacterium]|nr:dihydropteroate synthase [Oscillospiraceae bacterium]